MTYFSSNFDNVVHVIYSFHMSLFFVMAGYVSAYSYDGANFYAFCKKKINVLMKPYLCYGVVLFVFKFLRGFLSYANVTGGYNVALPCNLDNALLAIIRHRRSTKMWKG